jgi:exodeoxyribonuclease V gamma subunit
MAPVWWFATQEPIALFTVYHSNRLEALLDALVEVTTPPLPDPLAPEVIVTQSQGMARWVALAIAERCSVAANLDFVLPAAFVWRVFASQLPEVARTPGLDREVLVWRLMARLPELLEREGFEPLRRYLTGADRQRRLYQLCVRVADVFDRYLVYRPQELILRWEAGEGTDWQAQLWRALAADGEPHRAALLRRFLDPALVADPARLPARVCVFGIPTLPPAYLEVLAKLGRAIDVHLFALNPCLLYWGDIEHPRNIARIRGQRRRLGRREREDHYTAGNPLLASMGRQGRDFIDALHEHAQADEERFELPESRQLLGILQADILLLAERGRASEAGTQLCLGGLGYDERGDPGGRLPIDPADRSVQVHLCHSPMREVEVLHDQLLALFDADPQLRPQDVVVMAPDIETYAPYIEAVFGSAPEERRIPWALADLSRRSEQPLVQVFLQLLELPGGRLAASEVLSILEFPAVLRRYALEPEDFELIRRWVRESGIRWGKDGAARGALGLPELEANTWEFGFRRLFLGYAMAAGPERLFQGVLPCVEVEGQQAQVLGRLRSFIEQLAGFGRRLARAHTASEWALLVNELLDTFFEPDGDDAEPLQLVRDAMAGLVEEAGRAGYQEAFGIAVLKDYLGGHLAEPGAGQRLLSGRLTFCAMIPMRSLPFKVVALIGMNDGVFPRQRRPVGFDLVAEEPRRGDRSPREDDRYLFLEALISARQCLYISYVGRSIRDNSIMLPSVLVSELLDYIDQAFENGGRPARERLITDHPLQPFSDRYFAGEGALFSFADEWLTASHARDTGQGFPPFCSEPLAAGAEPVEVELGALCRFFANPAKGFLRERLGIWLEEAGGALPDTEPFGIDGLERHGLHTELLAHLLDGGAADEYRAVAKARGALPCSAFGERLLDGEVPQVEALAEAVRAHLQEPSPALEIDLRGADWRLIGWLDGLTARGLVRYRAGTLKEKDRLGLWIQHLALNAAAPEDCDRRSCFIAADGTWVLRPVADARERLGALVALYREGQRQPLRFFPKASMAYVGARAKGKVPLAAARSAWEGGRFANAPRGEGEDAHYGTAFRGVDPLDESFERLAIAVCEPMLAAVEEAG